MPEIYFVYGLVGGFLVALVGGCLYMEFRWTRSIYWPRRRNRSGGLTRLGQFLLAVGISVGVVSLWTLLYKPDF